MKQVLLSNYSKIEFGNHLFFMPCVPSNIYIKGTSLAIDMADMNSYVIVDGIKCYYCVIYDSSTDSIQTWLKDFTIDGLSCPQKTFLSFPLNADAFPFSSRDSRPVVPQRDYSELPTAFIKEHTDLDPRIVLFLRKHPEFFERVEVSVWLSLNKQLSFTDIKEDPFLIEDFLTKPIASIFLDEFIK